MSVIGINKDNFQNEVINSSKKDGKIVNQAVGARPKAQILSMLQ